MKTRLFLKSVALMSVMLMLASALAGAANFKKEYKLQVNVGPTFYWGMGAQKFADLVNEKTNGQIVVKPYFGSTLLKGAQLNAFQMVAQGVIDVAFESTINSATVLPQKNIFSLPFFINTLENLDKLETGETGKAIFAAMEEKGVMPLAWGENGFRQITNSKKEIKTPEDLKGLRVRVVGSPIFIDTFKALGADPINMNWGDAVTAFQQGTVDGQENPVGVLIPVQIHQYHKYATFWNYLADPLMIYWNKKDWDAFPDDIKAAIKEAAEQAARFEKALSRAGLDGDVSLNILKNEFNYTMEVADPVKFLQEKGMTVSTLSDAELQAFKDAVKPIYDTWVPKIGEDLYKKALADMGQ
ncbi:DctP10 protein [Candidatus Moduliflexus flocculans]|uniref:DctP10 protein n=1 Tax=Candidatus Moduliflexus flocculans TaxID=1499966 RepID=A0A0S6W4Z3_9BACT|nr:DctP10 protein [Candidatus Moduliflexus flocculans]